MKIKILIFVLLLLVIELDSLTAQTDNIKEGAYLSYIDFVGNSPSVQDSFKINRKTEIRKYKLFKIRSVNKKIKRRVIKKNVWCIYDGHDLYLNCYRISFKPGYTKVQESGRYLLFRSPQVLSISEKTTIRKSIVFGGAIGGTIASGVIHNKRNRSVYIIDLKSGVPHNLNQKYLLWILDEEPDLLALYNREKEQEDLETQLKYIRLLNERNSDVYSF